MGQNNSTAFQNSSAPLYPRRRTTSPPPRPAVPPTIPTPKTPTYVVPENKVLPNGTGDVSNARKLLRPVSQELTKFHPDFADIFQYDPELDLDPEDEFSLDQSMNASYADKENSSLSLNASGNSTLLATGLSGRVNYSPDGSVPNGKLPNSQQKNGHVRNCSVSVPSNAGKIETSSSNAGATNLRRSQSMDRDRQQPQKVPRHKRQTSLTSGISIQESVIFEDPREHLYNVARHEPFSNYQPVAGSLPLKSSFDMDYSMNLTYAQLAEYRRLKRATELEEKTGKKMEDLEAEIKASSTVPKSPFDRQNLGGKSGTHSISTGSSETGVSKSKKKKAPAPPPPGPVSRDKSPSGFSMATEPPADYDMDSLPGSPQRRSRSLQRNMSSASRKNSKSPAPQPLALLKSNSTASLPTPARAKALASSSVPSPNVPAAPSISGLASKVENGSKPLPGQASVQRSMSAAKEQLERLKKLEDMLRNPKPTDSGASVEKVNSDGNQDTSKDDPSVQTVSSGDSDDAVPKDAIDANGNGTVADVKGTESLEINVSDLNSVESKQDSNGVSKPLPDSMSSHKRMSSLLQHDIVLAAQARGAKIVKAKSPPAFEKPKDPAEMFREELAKAASQREERRKEASRQNSQDDSKGGSEPSTPRQDANIVFQSNFLKVSKKPTKQIESDQSPVSSPVKDASSKARIEEKNTEQKVPKSDKSKSEKELEDECLAAAASVDMSKRPSIQSEDMSISSSNTSQRVFAPDWTPEQDLDSDDDILDDSYTMTERRVSTEGFKASIIPPKIKELKHSKKDKKKKKPKEEEKVEEKRETLETSMDEKTKFGSIRRFKKSVHESMRNAFGSISKASGKILKKQKSHEFLDVRDPVPQRPAPDTDDEEPEVSRDPNWAFSGSQGKSLRRTASDGYIDHPYQNGVNDSEESSDDSEEAVRDIDFANGIDHIPKMHKRSQSSTNVDNSTKAMKRAGVAYVSQKGEIIVLPESQSVVRDKGEYDGHAPKIYKKKNKKYAFESTLKKQEKYRREEAIAREIREKEEQIEMERRKQQEMEKDFRRLRDLETQERLQRLQTANMRDQITMLQQQQIRQGHNELNNNAAGFSSLNNLNSLPNGTAGHSPYVSNGQLPTSQYLANGNVAMGGSGYMGGTAHLGNSASLVSQQRYSMPAFSTTVIGQPISHAGMATTTDPANYTSHTAPLVGGPTINGGVGGPVFPNLSSQEQAYLSDYMRMMGVAPPTNQQQWAVLLSTISYNTPGFPTYVPYQGQNGLANMGNGPDLSQLFGGGKTLDNTTANTKKQIISLLTSQQAFQPRDVTALQQRVPTDALYYKSMQLLDTSDPYPPHSQMYETPAQTVSANNNHSFENGAVVSSTTTRSQEPTVIRATDNNNGVVSVSVPDFRHSTAEARMDYLTSSNGFAEDGSQTVHGHIVDSDEIVTSKKSVTSPVLPAKVYGPLGFRPVSYRTETS